MSDSSALYIEISSWLQNHILNSKRDQPIIGLKDNRQRNWKRGACLTGHSILVWIIYIEIGYFRCVGIAFKFIFYLIFHYNFFHSQVFTEFSPCDWFHAWMDPWHRVERDLLPSWSKIRHRKWFLLILKHKNKFFLFKIPLLQKSRWSSLEVVSCEGKWSYISGCMVGP